MTKPRGHVYFCNQLIATPRSKVQPRRHDSALLHFTVKTSDSSFD